MIDWYSVLTKYGVSVPNQEQFIIHCPFHEDRRESCSINLEKGVWICFAGCGQGNLKYFIWKLSGKSWDEINSEFESKTWDLDFSMLDDIVEEDTTSESFQKPEVLNDVSDNHWIYNRGFTKETTMKWGCKMNQFLDFMIPVETQELETVGWISRRKQAIPKYLFSKGFAKSQYLFGISQLYDTKVVYIVEGALDCMWLSQFGYSSVAVLGASISQRQIDLISSLHPQEVVLALDNDTAGKKGIEKATLDMAGRFLISYLRLPKNIKDVQEISNVDTLHKVMKNKTIF